MRNSILVTVTTLVLMTAVGAAQGLSRGDALAAVYPGALIRAEQLFLTATDERDVRALAGVDVVSPLVAQYVATRDGAVVGRAYVDTHTVRTKRESLLVSLDPQGQVLRVDVTAFLEPSEYRPREAWTRQYHARGLSDDVEIGRAIRPLAGATLTARAVNAAIRRVLAIDRVLARKRDTP